MIANASPYEGAQKGIRLSRGGTRQNDPRSSGPDSSNLEDPEGPSRENSWPPGALAQIHDGPLSIATIDHDFEGVLCPRAHQG